MLPYQLVCEGKADQVFFSRLLKASGKDVDVSCPTQQEDGGLGNKAIHKRLIGFQAQFEKIATLVVAVDCDNDHTVALSEAQEEFEKANDANPHKLYPVPTQANTLTNGQPRTAIFLVPANGAQGALDSLLLPSFEQEYVGRIKCTNDFCTCLADPERGFTHDARLRLRAIIASTQKNPGMSLANLLEEKNCPVDLNHTSFDAIKAALIALFP